jgi:hypothetical protein
LLGGMFIFGGSSDHVLQQTAQQSELVQIASTIPVVIDGKAQIASNGPFLPYVERKHVFHFDTVNDISLYDDQKSVIEKKGKPQSVTADPLFAGEETYIYSDMNISFSSGIVEYIPSIGTIKIDDIVIPTTIQDMKSALGEPNYVAEDGIVFQRNDALIKIFIDSSTSKATSIQYYHMSNT